MALATDYCQRHGLELADKFTDSGLSAFKGKNQAGQLGKLITQLQPGDHLLVEDTDRLSRQGWVSIGRLLDEITSKGAVVVILRNELKITADNLNRDMGVIMQTVMGATLGSEESQKKSERIAAVYEAKRQAIRQGKATK